MSVVETIVDVDALLDTAVCSVGLGGEDNNRIVVIPTKEWCNVDDW